MSVLINSFQWFIGLGSNVFLPIIIFILGIIFGLKPGKALMSGITVGIGSIGLGLVLNLLSGSMGSAIQDLGNHYGSSLNILDIGVGVGGPLAFSTSLGLLMIPISLVVNIFFVFLGLTRTLNVDIWNFWFPIFMGMITQSITGNFVFGILGGTVAVMIQWLLADINQKKNSEFFGYPGIAISHMMVNSGAIIARPLNWIFDRIPGLNKIDLDTESLTKRFGILGDTVFIGLVIGALVGIFAKYDVSKIGNLAVSTAAVMKIMPKMVAMFMEGLGPIAEAASDFANNKLGGRQVNIGMGAALVVGHSAVMSTSILLVPISLALALVLPGNQVLPFGDLAFFAFAIAMMVPFFKGNVIRTVLGSAIYVVACLYLSTWLAPVMTDVFNLASFDVGTAGLVTMLLAALWPVALYVLALKYLGIFGVVAIGILVILIMYYINKIKKISYFQ